MVVKAAPDGYTLLITANTLVMTVSLYRNVPYDPIRDLAPVEQMATGTMAATLNPAVPAHSLKEFVAYAKANPGKLAYGSPGVGTPQHRESSCCMFRTRGLPERSRACFRET